MRSDGRGRRRRRAQIGTHAWLCLCIYYTRNDEKKIEMMMTTSFLLNDCNDLFRMGPNIERYTFISEHIGDLDFGMRNVKKENAERYNRNMKN